ncbi:hypothetical protein DCO58_06985 [Helicobacter saguini]|uniref:Uncharacterized protein n=1 Tax=Helicobacter saguini TaxID=1548018 RepID=A0A347VGJ5_9HELI|nr:hypothetical protein [Helicobacter saguini]MWV61922.1 hypothetical protein [Helicobacter saguini]MWV67403.1 hypothetical protein [Helicobacter saguini]MWV69756.1 hypothetical protein [Helicobacter saguini]MWV73027.1 hypothetical protein [Helicobacter saguini]TLD95597.1 hypothetical protein LS64_001710 [Helicobacter saguini]
MDFETRLVDSILEIEFQELDDSIQLKALQEYNELTQLHNNSIEKWLHSLHAKSGECKCGASNVIIGEMLVHIFKKLEHIENLISGDNADKYIPLKYKTHTSRLGHGIIILGDSKKLDSIESKSQDSNISHEDSIESSLQNPNLDSKKLENIESNIKLKKEAAYYARLNLPIFPVRCIPLFCIAREENVLEISKIGERDLKDYDAFIVGVEREMLKARKQQKL